MIKAAEKLRKEREAAVAAAAFADAAFNATARQEEVEVVPSESSGEGGGEVIGAEDGPADAIEALLSLKAECMRSPGAAKKLKWDDELPLDAWANVAFEAGEVAELDLAVRAIEGSTKRFDLELKFDLARLEGRIFGPALRVLNLEGHNGVSGSIAALAACPGLEACLLSVTAVVGDLKVFAGCSRLRHLTLGGGRGRLPITGDLAVFKSCPDLRSIKVFKAAVTGDVRVFRRCPKLESVNINKSAVSGDLAVFGNCPELRALTLSLTRVTGHLRTFADCPHLERLNLRGAHGVQGKAEDVTEAHPKCVVVI